ncbi:GNAT family N-acetyltransferase [Kribbella sp. NPDC050241]|uniref:GNAT family N-acetyltransferase n=1 Tax=Kribbella sp. NPDC050241 TaxID=3364115 RepID=UPI0037961F0E
MIVVRPATADDIDELLRLTEELDRFYGGTDLDPVEFRRQQVHEALFGDMPAAQVLLALEGETVVAFASYSYLWPAVGLTRSLYLKELYVSQAMSRRGAGRALMESLLETARKNGCSRVEWTTDVHNSASSTRCGLASLCAPINHRSAAVMVDRCSR